MERDSLKNLGLSSNEIDVYLSLLKMKAGTAIQITEASGLAKSTVYDTLRDLSQKGLVNMYKKGGRKHFSVNDPSVLKDLLAKQKTSLERVFPELLALYAKGSTGTTVKLYKGKEGIELVSEEIFSEATELIGIGSPEELFEKLPEFFPRFTKRRKERGIPFRSIFRDSPKARERKEKDMIDMRESRLVQPPLPFSSLMYVWNEKIAMLTFEDEVAVVVIENTHLSQMIRAIFELLWLQTRD